MFTAAFHRQCEALIRQINADARHVLPQGRVALGVSAASFPSGCEDYSPGDDFSRIDWQRCARHDEMLTQTFQGNEDRRVYLLVDTSARMRVGDPSKFDFAQRLAGMLGYLWLVGGDRVGIGGVGDAVVGEMAPARGTRHFPEWLRFVESLSVGERATSLRRGLQAFAAVSRTPGLVVIVSDWPDPADHVRAIDALQRLGHTPYMVSVHSRFEIEPNVLGPIALNDMTTGDRLHDELDDEDLRNYRRLFAQYRIRLREICGARRVGLLESCSDEEPSVAIRRMLLTTGRELERRCVTR